MRSTRVPAVAGRFYPDSPVLLREQVRRFVDASPTESALATHAIIAPHAGYVYSGAIAGCAYHTLTNHRRNFNRVIIIGPSHYENFSGIAVPSCDVFETPLGSVQVDRALIEKAMQHEYVHELDKAHDREHGLEVQLPFLQVMLDAYSLVPLVTGDCDARQVANLLDGLMVSPGTLLVVSSDLSHYHDYDTARDMDRATARAIEALDPSSIASDQACGQRAIQGLLLLAKSKGWQMSTLDLRSSGDTAGSRDCVVGYGAWVAKAIM